MKILSFLLAASISISAAQAAPNVIIGNDQVLTGSVATVPLTFQADGSTAGLDFVFSFDPSKLTPSTNCATSVESASVSCAVVGNTIKVLVAAPFTFPVPAISSGDYPLGTVDFTTTVSGTFPLAITESNFFDSNAAKVASTASSDGQILVTDPIQNGDANGDGVVDQADIAVVIDQYFGRTSAPGKPDCNQDGDVNAGDVICITNVALG